MIALLAAHLVLGLGLVAAGARVGRGGVAVGALAPAATLAWLATQWGTVVDGGVVGERLVWVPELGLNLTLRLDGFAALFVGLVSGIGVLVFVYAGRYLPAGGAGQGRLLGLLVLFSGSMLGLVLADDLVVLFGFWELTSLTSFLLIGNEHSSARARAAALQALLVTGLGGLAMLGGFVLISLAAGGTLRLSEVLAAAPRGPAVTAGLVLVLVGAFTKSAQYPFHSWLPGAMVAPTPVSAYLHSATMVKAGVYLIGRFAPAFTAVWVWRPLVVGVGLLTMVAGGLRALRQHDLKLILAYGTISQLGFMVVMFGLGTAATVVDACELVLAHALFKAALFMVVGIVEHQAGTRDIRRLPRPGPGWQAALAVTVVSAGSMAGFPLLFGFVAKEDAFAGLEPGSFAYAGLVLAPVALASMLTVAYSLRLAWAVLFGGRGPVDGRERGAAPPPQGWFVAPAAVLAVCTVVLGLVPALADGIISAAGESLTAAADPVHLAVWHGWNLPLLLSVVVLAGGAALFAARGPVAAVLARGARLPSAAHAYLATLRGLNVVADRTTAVVQSGSLPVYAGVILTTAATFTLGALVAGDAWPGWPRRVGSAGEAAACIGLVVFAIGAAAVRRRFAAALLLGATGYAMAGLFVARGGADLALTQVAIETLTTVLFVLVLRRLPDRFERRRFGTIRAVRVGRRPVRGGDGVRDGPHGLRERHDRAGLRRDGGAVGARGGRAQRRQRDPGRLPRPRHPDRDHGAGRRGHRLGGPGPGRPPSAPAPGRRAAPAGGAPARVRRPALRARRDPRRRRAAGVPGRAGRVDLPPLRRPQPARRRIRRRHRRRGGRGAALCGGRHRRGAPSVAGPPVDGAGPGAAGGGGDGGGPGAARRRAAGERDRGGRPAAAGSRQGHVRRRVRRRRLPRRAGAGADGLRVVR